MSLEWLLVVLLLGMIYWWDTSAVKDRARLAAKQQCELQDLQLLDDTVALKKTRLKRDRRGHISFLRQFTFEFSSDGEQRTQGELHLLGKKMTHLHLEVHRIH
ncbi:DUF3301 domain-containing protein [Oceanospirillaceae bacterium]|nr:DUF3301 domain-containing protein [Oceanospirillaceae bacterium]